MRLHVVTGPPCAGKSTFVDGLRTSTDLVIDLDRIASALGMLGEHIVWDGAPSVHRYVARSVRGHLIAKVLPDGLIRNAAGVAFLIDAAPKPWQMRAYRAQGATFTALDPGRAVCKERARTAGRHESTYAEIDRWYDAAEGATVAADVMSREW